MSVADIKNRMWMHFVDASYTTNCRVIRIFYVILCVYYCVYFIVYTVLLLRRNKQ